MKIVWGLSAVAALTAGIVCVAIHRHATAERRQHENALSAQEARITELSGQNGRLAARAAASNEILSAEQARELAKMRGKIRTLREAAIEQTRLATTNAQLRAAKTEAESRLAAVQAEPNYWPKDGLAFAGNADPESALKSMLWAMNRGDVNSWRTGCTPEARKSLEREWKKHGITEEQGLNEMKKMCVSLMAGSSGFHIVDTTQAAPNEVSVNLAFDGEDKVRTFVLKKIGEEWKFHDLLVAGQGPQKQPRR